jgi:hypothetical protein
MKNETFKLKGEATPEQIEAWKTQHGDVYEIEVEGHVCYVKGFTRESMRFALSQLKIKINTQTQSAEMDMEKILNIGEIGLQNCWLGGSDEINTNSKLWMAAALQVGEMFEIAEARIKKL